jgi:hypothetical protein
MRLTWADRIVKRGGELTGSDIGCPGAQLTTDVRNIQLYLVLVAMPPATTSESFTTNRLQYDGLPPSSAHLDFFSPNKKIST